mmetsp:Transcript_42519/g.108825  ORF Transcript_42519/g.108825 Transcript_42519/m.108825 type:complete len:459 (-) Transcript_42519:535-1911(-)
MLPQLVHAHLLRHAVLGRALQQAVRPVLEPGDGGRPPRGIHAANQPRPPRRRRVEAAIQQVGLLVLAVPHFLHVHLRPQVVIPKVHKWEERARLQLLGDGAILPLHVDQRARLHHLHHLRDGPRLAVLLLLGADSGGTAGARASAPAMRACVCAAGGAVRLRTARAAPAMSNGAVLGSGGGRRVGRRSCLRRGGLGLLRGCGIAAGRAVPLPPAAPACRLRQLLRQRPALARERLQVRQREAVVQQRAVAQLPAGVRKIGEEAQVLGVAGRRRRRARVVAKLAGGNPVHVHLARFYLHHNTFPLVLPAALDPLRVAEDKGGCRPHTLPRVKRALVFVHKQVLLLVLEDEQLGRGIDHLADRAVVKLHKHAVHHLLDAAQPGAVHHVHAGPEEPQVAEVVAGHAAHAPLVGGLQVHREMHTHNVPRLSERVSGAGDDVPVHEGAVHHTQVRRVLHLLLT